MNTTASLEQPYTESISVAVITVLISLLIVITVLGNILVMLAFILDKRLRTQSNFFLLNLAICDFLLGAVAIPLYIPYMLTGKWLFGKFLCKLWLVVDYTMCTASAFNVALISYDRFLCVTMAVLYRSLQNRHSQTVLKMLIVWILSFLLYSPAILLWESIVGYSNFPDDLCIAEFHYTWYFLLVASSIGFGLPFISITFFNLSIYWNINKRSRRKRQSLASQSAGKKEDSAISYIIATNVTLSNGQSDGQQDTKPPIKRRWNFPFYTNRQQLGSQANLSSTENGSKQSAEIHIIKLSRDKKVAKSLAILITAIQIESYIIVRVSYDRDFGNMNLVTSSF
ncbi:histamine H3 receptor-like [Dendropsophus ebraccatus]|uniref:histamine H3 receptor-like n=1 Tax=Dendropsophus ebraccatus TaxID=150705 RepID=UPI003831CC93